MIAIDPKGDLGNLLLLFEDLTPASFEPWIDVESARRDGLTPKAAAEAAAAAWKKGLADWGLGPADIKALRAAHEATIYTPGSGAGVPLNVLQSLEAPAFAFDSAEEDLRDEIASVVGGMLGLLKIDADPLQSREHILLSNLIEHVLARRARPHARGADPRRRRPAVRQARRAAAGERLPAARARGPDARAQQPAGVAAFRGLARGRPARRREAAAHRGRPPAAVDRVHGAPGRRRAALRDRPAPRQGQDLDAPPARHLASCARSSTWTRSTGTSRPIPRTRRPSARCSRC